MKDRIQQVVGVVPNKSEEEVCIALHDHDYDPERAITSLLDTDVKQVWVVSGVYVCVCVGGGLVMCQGCVGVSGVWG